MTSPTTIASIADLGAGVPGYQNFIVWGINDQGEVIGTSYDDPVLPSVGGGDIGGTVTVNVRSADAALGQSSSGWFFQNGAVAALAAPGSGGSTAYAIDNEGDVAGAVGTGVGAYGSTAAGSQAAIWQNGKMTLLGRLPGDAGSFASMINDKGQVIGQSSSGAFLWQNGQMTEIAPGGQAWWINDLGQIVGQDASGYAYEWQNGTLTKLPYGYAGHAQAINDAGVIVGQRGNAVVWLNGTVASLPGISNGSASDAVAINNSNIIVGMSAPPGGGSTPTVWQNGVPYALSSFLPAGSGWVLQTVTAINDQNQVVGQGLHNGVETTYEITLPSVFPAASLTATEASSAQQTGLMTSPVTVTSSVYSLTTDYYYLHQLQSAGLLASVILSDSGTPVLTLGQYQDSEMSVVDAITTPCSVTLTLSPGSSSDILQGSKTHPTLVDLQADYYGAAYQFVGTGDGTSFTVETADNRVHYQFSHVTALEVGSATDIVASAIPALPNGVSSAQVTEIYAAALDREPDLAGLSYYEQIAATNSGVTLQVLAQWFLQSPEYTGNSAHAYAQTAAGDAQFIGDLYTNLLHRTASASDISWYQTNVIAPILSALTPGSAAYGAAELQAHAALLADISQSSEFLLDVRTTGTATNDARHWLILI